MNDISREIREAVRAIKRYIEYEKECAIDIDASKRPVRKMHGAHDGPEGLDALKKEVLSCKSCDLHKTRRNVVFGAGNPKTKLMFIGEAPGEEEDLQGLPFVGRAGQLLTKIIEAMGLKRSDVYIANILKCRPPNNRAPLPAEILSCRLNVKKQVGFIRPKVICTLGKFASQALLNTEKPISALRGKFCEYEGIKVMPTFHPAYLLRNPQDKRLVWEDMKKIREELSK